MIGIKIALLFVTIQAVSSGLFTPPECFNPTACDGALASCTIGLGCLGSPITMCGTGLVTSNGACQTFANSTTNYCECQSCVGIVNEVLFYDCKCGGPTEYVCPSGYKLVSCASKVISGVTQYVCCQDAGVC